MSDAPDIVERLRVFGSTRAERDAANEIERLRERLADAEQRAEHWERMAFDARADMASTESEA